MRTRIRTVRFKNGGEIRLLQNPREKLHGELVESLSRDCAAMVREHEGQLAGFALVAWSADGSVGAQVRITAVSPYVQLAIPTIAAEAIRRVIIKCQIETLTGQN